MESSRRHDHWVRLTLLFAATGFVESMSFGHYLTFLPLLVKDLGVASSSVPETVGFLATVSLLAGLPLVPFWGAWADRYSRKIIIVRSAVVEALLFVLLAFVSDVRQLFLLVPLVGLVLGNTGVMLAEITDRAPRERLGLAISVVGAAGPLGLAVGPLIGGPIVDQHGLQTLFLLDAAITGCIVAALVVGYHEAADRVRSLLPVLTLVRRSLIAVLRTPLAQGVFVTYFFVLLGQRLVTPFLALYVEAINGPVLLASTVGLVAGVYGLAATIGSPLAGALADRVGFGRVLLGSIALASMASFAAAALHSLLPFAVDYALLGVGFATAGAMLFATLATGLPADIRSAVLNLALVPAYLSGIVGSLLAVQVVQRSEGDLRVLWVMAGLLVAVALIPAWRLEALVRRRATLSA
jgi:MFS transporter, DHA1 family, multidrug resistance protein